MTPKVHNKLLVNFYGGSGIGKTTVAAEVFVELKKKGIETEIISEYAKDMILQGQSHVLNSQWMVFANQAWRILCGYQSMQVTLTDSPLLLIPVYDADKDGSAALRALCLEHYHRYNNLNVVLSRKAEYEHRMVGRVHSLTESISIDNRIVHFLDENNIPYIVYDEYGLQRTVELIIRQIGG